MNSSSALEPLEARIAPAIVAINPIADAFATPGQKALTLDLDTMFDASGSYRQMVVLQTNFVMPGATDPGAIRIELFGDSAPLTVANFLRYVNNAKADMDYDGLFFHRLVQGFVLQGGGSDAVDNSHIDTFPPVHNEFDPNDPERSNLAYTVAMAKVASTDGGGPHSATSEFFINLADNAANLDAQNGGFTVFGRISPDSIALVDAISQLQIVGGAPVQNYQGGTVLPENKIQIVDAFVDARISSPTPEGYTYAVSVTDADTDLPTKLVTAKVNANTNDLTLRFNTSKSGVAKVAVTVSKSGETPHVEEFFVTVKPNLITKITDDGLENIFVPGDKGTAKVQLTNTGGSLAKGTATVQLYLSKEGDTSYTLEETGDDADLLFWSQDIRLNIAAGKTATHAIKYAIPAFSSELALEAGVKYRLLAKVVTEDGTEIFTDDNVGTYVDGRFGPTNSAVQPTFDVAFGSVGGRLKPVGLTLDSPSGALTFSLTGGGSGIVTKDADGNFDLSISGTSAASVLSVKAARGVVGQLDDITISQTIGQVKLGNVDLSGNFVASGGAKSIIFGNLGDTATAADRDFSVNAFPIPTQKLALSLGAVADYSVSSNMPIGKFTAASWSNDAINTAANQIFAPSIDSLRISGDLEADVLIATEARMAQFFVDGALRNSTVKTFGDINAVKLGSMIGSSILAGLNEKPDDLADLALGRLIGSFKVTGSLSDSVVASARFNSVTLGSVDSAAGTEVKGIYADAIKSYIRKGANPERLSRLDTPGTFDAAQNYEVVLF